MAVLGSQLKALETGTVKSVMTRRKVFPEALSLVVANELLKTRLLIRTMESAALVGATKDVMYSFTFSANVFKRM